MNPTIQTASGRYINFVDLSQNEYDIGDIAHALSNLCRFTGHVSKFYSVAQHCVLASYVVPEDFAFEALMHDRIEAYMGDMSSPLKHMMPTFKEVEHRMECDSAICFMLPEVMSSEVKHADLVMLATEKRDLMVHNNNGSEWAILNNITPREAIIDPWGPELARKRFLARYDVLWAKHQEKMAKLIAESYND